MFGIYVNENGCIPYAELIVKGIKTVETRSKDMLKSLVGERVAIIRTHRNKKPMVIGYATISAKWFCKADEFRDFAHLHFVPELSAYDCKGKGKWFYFMGNAKTCEPYELPKNTINHGRSYCEF